MRRRGSEEESALFSPQSSIKGNHRCRLYNPGSTSTIFTTNLSARQSLLFTNNLDQSSLASQTNLYTTNHYLNPNDQQLHNNVVVLSIPKGRDQADPGRMLVSLGPPPRRPLDLPTDATSSLFLSCGTKCSPISGSEACSCPGQCSCAGCPNRKTEAVDSDPKEGCS